MINVGDKVYVRMHGGWAEVPRVSSMRDAKIVARIMKKFPGWFVVRKPDKPPPQEGDS